MPMQLARSIQWGAWVGVGGVTLLLLLLLECGGDGLSGVMGRCGMGRRLRLVGGPVGDGGFGGVGLLWELGVR